MCNRIWLSFNKSFYPVGQISVSLHYILILQVSQLEDSIVFPQEFGYV